MKTYDRARMHRALDAVINAKANDVLTTITNFDYGRGRSKELDDALDDIKGAYKRYERTIEVVKEIECDIRAANAKWRKLDAAWNKAHKA